jgi:putative Holliday junction resolvase
VVGLPLSLSGEAGRQAERTMAFADALRDRLGFTVHLWDERLSTQEAQRRMAEERPGAGATKGRRLRSRKVAADTDALAASIILQAFLDSRSRALK